MAWFVATVVAVTIAAAAVGSVRSEVTDAPTALGISASPDLVVSTSEGLSDASGDGAGLEEGTLPTPARVTETTTSLGATASLETTTIIDPPIAKPLVLAEVQARHEEAAKSLPQGGSTSTTAPAPTRRPGTTPTTTPPPSLANPTPTTTVPTAAPTTTTTTAPAATPTTTTTTAPVATPTTTTTHAPDGYTRVIDTDGGSLSVRVIGDDVFFRRAFPNNGWNFDLANGGPEVIVARFTRIDDLSSTINVLIAVIDGVLDASITQSS